MAPIGRIELAGSGSAVPVVDFDLFSSRVDGNAPGLPFQA